MNIYQVTTRPRHCRYMYFIDEHYAYDELLKLVLANHGWWGGRYNPIVPVSNGQIIDGYLQIIEHYDPDLIFYSQGIDPEMLKKLRKFNPLGHYNMDIHPREENISGVSTFYMLSDFDSNTKVMLPSKIWPPESVLPSFYDLNFGLSPIPYQHEYEMSKKHQQLEIDGESFAKLNETIHRDKPVNMAALAKIRLNTKVLRSRSNVDYNDFELVIAKDKTSNSDLLYYWNRGLYQNKNLMYVTIEQLNELCRDKYFGGLLYDMKGDSDIRVVSTTLTKIEIETLIKEKLYPITFQSTFQYFDVSEFLIEEVKKEI